MCKAFHGSPAPLCCEAQIFGCAQVWCRLAGASPKNYKTDETDYVNAC